MRVPFLSTVSSCSASFRSSREHGPKTPITAQLIELRGFQDCCCVPELRWLLLFRSEVGPRGQGGSEDLYCWGPGWEVVPQFQHTIHHQQRHSYAEFYNPFSFFSSLSHPPLSHSPYFTTTHKSFHPLKYYKPSPVLILTLCFDDGNISTSRITT